MFTPPYKAFHDALSLHVPATRLFADELHTLAYGTDASFYRLIPKIVVKVESEREVLVVLAECRKRNLPLTFRAAGTSLSGQSVSDSILVMLGAQWRGYSIEDGGNQIRLQPGVIGAHANAYLAPYGKKLGPDPASINAAMIGGIAANNASGMCCGTAQNSYRTLAAMRMILPDGSLLDTGNVDSRREFHRSHADLIGHLRNLSDGVKTNTQLASRIRSKYKMKNTTGYSLNALVDFDDPIDILQHLMIGSEGTLGFIEEITYNTVDELPAKASSLILFPDIESACDAVATLKSCPVDAVELMDRASLHSIEGKSGMPDYLPELGPAVASLLVETRARTQQTLEGHIETIVRAISHLPKVRPVEFTIDPAESKKLWDIRKGLFPSVGAMRQTGTTVIIEDVAFPVPRLARATHDLRRLFDKHGYGEAIIFGHALEGNLHFVFPQDFNIPAEVQRYKTLIEDVTSLVVDTYHGSLKAEHGTGRNMAPFVQKEWGQEAYELMKSVKRLIDPTGIMNPGVILNEDPEAHLKHLKPLPAADPIVDKCIECGFCETHCPSKDLTLTPRQRIVLYREIVRRRSQESDTSAAKRLSAAYEYPGMETCATDGLCALACPVGIDTGKLVKALREKEHGAIANSVASVMAEHMGSVTLALRGVLNVLESLRTLFGNRLFGRIAASARSVTGSRLPLWNSHVPRSAGRMPWHNGRAATAPLKVVYYPSCINRTFGMSHDRIEQGTLMSVTCSLFRKAGYEIIFPENLPDLCCGMAFDSKGYRMQGSRKSRELGEALLKASAGGTIPVYVDMSPCLHRMKETLPSQLQLYEPIEFILAHLDDKLEFSRLNETVAIHTPCSAIKMGLEGKFKELAGKCAREVLVPDGIECCGWAGDRGFTVPELNASALSTLRLSIPEGCSAGYSTSRTCEIGLSLHGGIPYNSIVYLVDRCTRPKNSTHVEAVAARQRAARER